MEWALIVFAVVFVVALVGWWASRSRREVESVAEPGVDPRDFLVHTLSERVVLAHDLIDQVKPHAPHERWLFSHLAATTEHLEEALDAGVVEPIVDADRRFESALHDLLAVADVYPALTETEEYAALSQEIAEAQEQRSDAIRSYAEAPGGIPVEQWGMTGGE